MIEEEEDFGDFGGQSGWVIPHRTTLDYCKVDVIGTAKDGRLRVEGRRSHGWTPDGAFVRCGIDADKLTQTPSWHRDFLELYDDPCQPTIR